MEAHQQAGKNRVAPSVLMRLQTPHDLRIFFGRKGLIRQWKQNVIFLVNVRRHVLDEATGKAGEILSMIPDAGCEMLVSPVSFKAIDVRSTRSSNLSFVDNNFHWI